MSALSPPAHCAPSATTREGLLRIRQRIDAARRRRLGEDLPAFAGEDLSAALVQCGALPAGAHALVDCAWVDAAAAARELHAQCEAHGLRIDVALPHGFLLGSLVPQRRLAGTACGTYAWDNLLSWAAYDERFGACLEFLETEMLAALPLAASDCAVVRIAKRADPAHNAAWLAAQSERAAYLAMGLTREAFAFEDTSAWERMRAMLAAHVAYEPNLVFVHRLLSVAHARAWPVRTADFLDTEIATRLAAYMHLHDIDVTLNAVVAALYTDPQIAEVLRYEGVALGLPLDYDAMVDLTAALAPQLPSRVRT